MWVAMAQSNCAVSGLAGLFISGASSTSKQSKQSRVGPEVQEQAPTLGLALSRPSHEQN